MNVYPSDKTQLLYKPLPLCWNSEQVNLCNSPLRVESPTAFLLSWTYKPCLFSKPNVLSAPLPGTDH